MSKNLILLLFAILLFAAFAVFSCTPVPPPTYMPITPAIQTVIKNIGWVQGMLIIGVVGSIFACFNGGAKFGLPLLISCLVGYGLTSAMLFYAKIIALTSLFSGVGLCGYFIFIKHRALKEIIDTVEFYKKYTKTAAKDNAKIVVKEEIQSPTTTKLVSKIKKD